MYLSGVECLCMQRKHGVPYIFSKLNNCFPNVKSTIDNFHYHLRTYIIFYFLYLHVSE